MIYPHDFKSANQRMKDVRIICMTQSSVGVLMQCKARPATGLRCLAAAESRS